jgi:putative transcriptional regulator
VFWNYLERGDYNPSLELGLKIAAYFDVPVDLIFSLAPFPSLTETLRGPPDPEDAA